MSIIDNIIPEKLQPGDLVAIAAPAGVFDRERFLAGIYVIEKMGFRIRIPEEVMASERGFAGNDDMRLRVLSELFTDHEVRAILCARGGYGSLRLLDRIDYVSIRNNPKIFAGFSDITALLGAIYDRAGLVCYHAPVVTSLGESDEDVLTLYETMLKTYKRTSINAEPGIEIVGGRAEGRLAGGNLATLNHMLGTPFMPDLSGSILVLEDIAEPPYKIDRMLTQMALAGVFDDLRGIVFGQFTECGDPEQVNEVLHERFSGEGIPVLGGFPFGHSQSNKPFPVGSPAILDSATMTLVYDL